MSWKGNMLQAGIQSNGDDISLFQRTMASVLNWSNPQTIATVGNHTLTTTELLSRLILRDPAGGARTDTTPSAIDIINAIYDAKVGDSFLLMIRNTADAAETLTIAGGTGVTISGTATIAQNNTKIFLVRVDATASGSEAVTVYSIGTLTH